MEVESDFYICLKKLKTDRFIKIVVSLFPVIVVAMNNEAYTTGHYGLFSWFSS